MHEPRSDHPTDEQLHAFSLGLMDAVGSGVDRRPSRRRVRSCCAALEHFAAPDAMVARLREAVAAELASREDGSDRESAVRALQRGRWREASMPRRAEPIGTSHQRRGGFDPTADTGGLAGRRLRNPRRGWAAVAWAWCTRPVTGASIAWLRSRWCWPASSPPNRSGCGSSARRSWPPG